MDYIEYLRDFRRNEGVDSERLDRLKLPKTLPPDYIEFLKISNGGEGFVGAEYMILYRGEDLMQTNAEYHVDENAPGIFLFGSNGGGEALAFDLRDENRIDYVLIPFMFDYNDIIVLGSSFSGFIKRVATQGYFV
ncbi:SMI1/KNR4 family protein [Leptonema illini]|uniref:Cell wall assembly/cell proliferation coordinating protein, KNR4-like protein n=1 Tax=Leptonema illini DSM 21528 TaxID=929563 RepID=H2CGK8_9LEPT|nr:SMI1/KNR4 family protein [Leptonema illini]EHQ07925.1 Cell wall assembly/cell proliferation coordinating protein, KNR4-like protein [Leptonema illini DSM 21528]